MRAGLWPLIPLISVSAACGQQTPSTGTSTAGFSIKCKEHALPRIELDPGLNPTPEQQTALCRCVSSALGPIDYVIAKHVASGKPSIAPNENQKAFPAHFRAAITKCGGSDLDIPGVVDFESEAHLVQRIDPAGAKKVRISFSCRSLAVQHVPAGEPIELRVTGTYSIHGYHGTRKHARAIPIESDALRFKVSVGNGGIQLESPEWAVVHHSILVKNLQLSVPFDSDVSIDCLSSQQLAQRGNQ